MNKVKKLLGALLGAVTAGGVLLVANAFGLDVDAATATAVAGLLASLGTYLAPANEVDES